MRWVEKERKRIVSGQQGSGSKRCANFSWSKRLKPTAGQKARNFTFCYDQHVDQVRGQASREQSIQQPTGSQVGDDLVEAFQEMAAYLRGEVEAQSYEMQDDLITPERVKAIRRTVAASTKEFEQRFRISARTMEPYEQGRRRPDAAMQALLRVIEREPDAVRRALGS
ncbi:helix-turn-helix domain-containing protein [Methylobacterium sp. CM6247]